MLYEAHGITKFVVVCGYTDLRKGIEGLSQLVEGTFGLTPFETGTLFLFCGKRGDRIKALLWEGNGFLLLYKRFENGSLSWPRTPKDAVCISKHEYRLLLQGLNPVRPKIRESLASTAF
ncbi:MAG: IS66 family insertion sequence element accessory protein TnpB [Lachnospiraceae bacterium]|nr:IS66 family insertion sequence element accessory protein TnpB [Lachnospiraceae bacterium]